MRRLVYHAIAGLATLLVTGVADPAGAISRREGKQVETVEARPAGAPHGDCLAQQSARHDL